MFSSILTAPANESENNRRRLTYRAHGEKGQTMNRTRRRSLQSIIDQLVELKGSLEDIQTEEEEYRDNIPENMQESRRYERADEACNNLSDAVENLEEVISSIEAAIE